MAWYPYAKQVKTHSNWVSGLMIPPLHGLLLHITDGVKDKTTGEKVLGTIENIGASFDENNNSTHFAIAKSGEIWQFVDTDQRAKAMKGSWGDAKWISVENFALPGEELTSGQILSVARLYGWLVNTKGIPLREVDVNKSRADFDTGTERGLGGHSMYKDTLREDCPGPAILRQRALILSMVGAG
ncbi:MAG: N-acetylmuramoyl-L-alanine amidase [Pyrinomonadaceae bacterium]